MIVTFLTGHAAHSERKTGFHFWAEILKERGHQVNWITVGFSALTLLKGADHVPKGPYNRWSGSNPRSFVWCPVMHPVNLGNFTTLFQPLFDLYPKQMPGALTRGVRGSDILIVDSGAGLMLVPDLAAQNPNAQFVYFASDRMETLKAHPAIMAAEQEALPYFSLIRVISESRLGDFAAHRNVRYIPQGVDKAAFDNAQNPYKASENVVCAGDMLFDADSVGEMARSYPEWHFHLFGRNTKMETPHGNITQHGEQAFENIVPYIKYADIALAPYRSAKGGDYFAQSSLKIAQYTYARLPVLVPDILKDTPPHLISYRPGDGESIHDAFVQAMRYDRRLIPADSIPGWNEVMDAILAYAGEQTHEAA